MESENMMDERDVDNNKFESQKLDNSNNDVQIKKDEKANNNDNEDLSFENALEKLEEDLAESIGEADETPAAPEGATRVVKRVRKKPTTTTKGVADKAEKKE